MKGVEGAADDAAERRLAAASAAIAICFDEDWYLGRNRDVAAADIHPLLHYLRYGEAEGRWPNPCFDPLWYKARNPDLPRDLGPLEHYVTAGEAEGRNPGPYFDVLWYRRENGAIPPDASALQHYLERGRSERRPPSPYFDPTWYLARNADVAASGLDPLDHFIQFGDAQGRSAGPYFDGTWYRERNPDLRAGTPLLRHYLDEGAAAGRDPSPYFDLRWYRAHSPDAQAGGAEPIRHYLVSGLARGRSPSPYFDAQYYLASHPDLATLGIEPLRHYLAIGAREGRRPNPHFDPLWYASTYPDVFASGLEPLRHYISRGAALGRQPSPHFDSAGYSARYPDVTESGLEPLRHYLERGIAEGRDARGRTPAFAPVRPEREAGPEPYAAAHRRRDAVVIVTPDIVGPIKNGGIGTATLHIARTLAAAGVPVEILFVGTELTTAELAHWRERYAAERIGFFGLSDVPAPGARLFGMNAHLILSWRISRWLQADPPAYALFQDWHGNGFWSVRAKQAGVAFADTCIAVITHSGTEWIREGMQTLGTRVIEEEELIWSERQAIEGADVLVSPNRYMVEWLRRKGYGLPQRVEICPVPYEAEAPAPAASGFDPSHLIFFGRLETRKGLHIFGAALRRLAEAGEPLPRTVSFLGKHASVAGEPSLSYLAALEADLPGIEFVVRTDLDSGEALDYIRQRRGLVVIPSLVDNAPLVVSECIRNGLAFIASSAGGIPELAAPDVLFAPDVDSLTAMLRRRATLGTGPHPHPYDLAEARRLWLKHIAEMRTAAPRSASARADEHEPPPVSVVIPFYKHDRYLPRLVEAFRAMQLDRLQLVIVDDGSPPADRTGLETLRPELEAAGHIVAVQPNAGPGAARNHGIERAAHDLILFFDADNLPFPELVRALWRTMRRMQADSVSAPFAAVPPMTGTPKLEDVLHVYQPPGGPLVSALFDNTLGDTTALVRKAPLKAVGLFPTELARPGWEDLLLFLRLLGHGYRHVVHPEPLLFYTHDPQRVKSPLIRYENRVRLLEQLQTLNPAILAEIGRVLAAHSMVLRDQGRW